MNKRLVVCLDGTWNTPDDKLRSTNVVKIMRAILHTSEEGTKQITFYDKGVGTGGPIDRLEGGAFGRGIDDNVRDGYRFLANNYEPGDEVYIFGFSRGAFLPRFNRPEPGTTFVNEMIHQSALDRFGQSVPVQDGDRRSKEVYHPDNLAAAQGKLPVVGYPGEVI